MKKSLVLVAFSLMLGSTLVMAEDPAQTGTEDTYPLKTCVVSGKSLGSMGGAVKHEHKVTAADGTETVVEVRFCCKPCIKKFEADPEKFLKKLEDAKTGS